MPKEYRTIQEVAGPLMLVRDVEGVTYDELGEIELASGEKRRCRVLEIDGGNALVQLFESDLAPFHQASYDLASSYLDSNVQEVWKETLMEMGQFGGKEI